MSPSRSLIIGGLLSCLCLVIWSSGTLALQVKVGEWQPSHLENGFIAFWIAQPVLISLWSPTHITPHPISHIAATVTAFFLLPLPLLTIAWLMGMMEIDFALTRQAISIAFAMAIILVGLALRRSSLSPGIQRISHYGIQIVTSAAAASVLLPLGETI